MSPAPTPERPDANRAGTRPQRDVSQRRREPPTSARIEQPIFGLLLAAAGLFLVAAAIGLPLPFLPEKTNGDDNAKNLHAFVSSLGDWVRYPGWRYSAGAWFYAAVAAGATSAAFTWGRATTWSRPRRFLTVGGAAVLVFCAGPLVQNLLGIPWSNYDTGPYPIGDPIWEAPLILSVGYSLLLIGFFAGGAIKFRDRRKRSVRRSLDDPKARRR
ncbi:hypothetical protein [Frondihabitans cladoniiphilus]|uniref:Uncharacterized protein n=1 Tax=Frondihabitans cladoniiphilus TaxID=715785 RepID=A0ABP8VPB2_9MICO